MKQFIHLESLTTKEDSLLEKSRNILYFLITIFVVISLLLYHTMILIGEIFDPDSHSYDILVLLFFIPPILLYIGVKLRRKIFILISRNLLMLVALVIGVLSDHDYQDITFTAMVFVLFVFIAANIIKPYMAIVYGGVFTFLLVFLARDLGYAPDTIFIFAATMTFASITSYILAHAMAAFVARNENQSQLINELYSNQNRLIEDVAHKLKTPLSVLNSEVSDLGGKGTLDVEVIQNFLGDIQESIASLLSSSKTTTDMLADPGDTTSVQQLMSSIEKDANLLIKHYQRGNDVRVEFNLSYLWKDKRKGVPLSIYYSADLLREVILNLIDNAIKHNRTEPSVVINATMSRVLSNLVIEVQDSGVGITNERLESIRTGVNKGDRLKVSGVGLQIVRDKVLQLEGEFQIDSEVGKGTRVRVSLPCVMDNKIW